MHFYVLLTLMKYQDYLFALLWFYAGLVYNFHYHFKIQQIDLLSKKIFNYQLLDDLLLKFQLLAIF